MSTDIFEVAECFFIDSGMIDLDVETIESKEVTQSAYDFDLKVVHFKTKLNSTGCMECYFVTLAELHHWASALDVFDKYLGRAQE